MTTEPVNNTESQAKTITTPKRVRSPYLFPAYNFAVARQIAERVELDGAGSLSEPTLAISLHLSATSSGFHLKTLTARQFGLLIRQGETLSTTPLAKAIFKPKTEDEKKNAMVDSFLAIPLFREVATRFRGTPLPQSQALRNILEREFGIDSKRISDAERVLMDSARDTGVLVTSGNNTYLSTDKTATVRTNGEAGANQPPPPSPETPSGGTLPLPPKWPTPPVLMGRTLPLIEEADLLELDDDKFKQFWSSYGDILRARAKRGKPENK